MIIATQFKKFIDLNFKPSYLYKLLKCHFREQHMLIFTNELTSLQACSCHCIKRSIDFFLIEKRKIWILDFDTCNGSHVVKSYILNHNLIWFFLYLIKNSTVGRVNFLPSPLAAILPSSIVFSVPFGRFLR